MVKRVFHTGNRAGVSQGPLHAVPYGIIASPYRRAVSQLQLAAQTAAGCMLEDLRKDMDALLNNLLLFAARAAFAGEWSLAGSKRRLGAIGFTLEPSPPGIAKFVAVVAGFAFVWSSAWLIGSGKVVHTPGAQSVGMMRTLVMTPLYLIVNFWVVYYFKRQYAFVNETIFGQLPVRFICRDGNAFLRYDGVHLRQHVARGFPVDEGRKEQNANGERNGGPAEGCGADEIRKVHGE